MRHRYAPKHLRSVAALPLWRPSRVAVVPWAFFRSVALPWYASPHSELYCYATATMHALPSVPLFPVQVLPSENERSLSRESSGLPICAPASRDTRTRETHPTGETTNAQNPDGLSDFFRKTSGRLRARILDRNLKNNLRRSPKTLPNRIPRVLHSHALRQLDAHRQVVLRTFNGLRWGGRRCHGKNSYGFA